VKYKILIIFAIAFFIRLIAINQSLWLDEATTARVVQQYNYQEIITKFSPNDFHPPFYYLFMKLWTNIVGYSEVALRMPSVLFSLATGYVVYLIAGIWGAVFFLFNPLIIYYSQEARMYMMATFFLTGALHYFLQLVIARSKVTKQSHKNEIATAAFGGLAMTTALLTFYGSFFLVAAFLTYFLYKKQYKYFIVSLLIFIISLLLISPLLYKQLVNSKIALANVTNWSLVLGKANIKNLLLIPVKFSIGRISFEPKGIYYLVAGIWTTFVISQIAKLKTQNQNSNPKSINLFLYLFIFPLALGFVISFITPLLQYFRFIYLIPIMSILLTFSILGKPLLHRSSGAGLIGVFLMFSLIYLLIPQFHREDWKSLVKSLPSNKPVYMITSSSDVLRYYNNSLKVIPLRSDFIGTTVGQEEIIVIPYTAEIHGVDYQKILQEKNYRLVNKKVFRGLELEHWANLNPTEAVK